MSLGRIGRGGLKRGNGREKRQLAAVAALSRQETAASRAPTKLLHKISQTVCSLLHRPFLTRNSLMLGRRELFATKYRFHFRFVSLNCRRCSIRCVLSIGVDIVTDVD